MILGPVNDFDAPSLDAKVDTADDSFSVDLDGGCGDELDAKCLVLFKPVFCAGLHLTRSFRNDESKSWLEAKVLVPCQTTLDLNTLALEEDGPRNTLVKSHTTLLIVGWKEHKFGSGRSLATEFDLIYVRFLSPSPLSPPPFFLSRAMGGCPTGASTSVSEFLSPRSHGGR